MITSAHRFHGFNALSRTYGRGQTVRGPLFAIKYLHNPRRSSYRAAVVVSRKVHKSAVVRGRIRRRIYEIIRELELRIVEPYDVIVTVFSDRTADMPHQELRTMVVGQLENAGIFSGDTSPSSQLPRVENKPHAIVDAKERT